MAGSVNKVILIGRLGADVELRVIPSGSPVANFRIATNESWKDKAGAKQTRTEWHRIVAWGKTAEICNEYLSKGREVYIEGRIQTRQWDDRDGVKRYTTEVVAQNVTFLGSRQQSTQASTQTTNTESNDLPVGDVPPELEGQAAEVYQNMSED